MVAGGGNVLPTNKGLQHAELPVLGDWEFGEAEKDDEDLRNP
jgi:hypothetical protein